MQTFADQAVIAIENTRLFNETKEALERQTATSDILKVIASSPNDVQPVFEAIAESARLLLGSFTAVVTRVVDGVVHLGASTAEKEATAHAERGLLPYPLVSDRIHARVARTGQVVATADIEAATHVPQDVKEFARTVGWRSKMVVPMLRNGVAIGTIGITRREPGTFDGKMVDLLKIFADHAVIAIENARLFNEVQAKTHDLEEALRYQTGSANILNVIASSPTNVQPVLKAIVESACVLCDAYDAVLRLRIGDDMVFGAHHGPIPVHRDVWPLSSKWTGGRSVIEQRPVHIADYFSEEGDEFPEGRVVARQEGHRSILSVPLLREGEGIGALTLRRREANPFQDKQIALLQTFADQAVIAIGNVRLFDEVQAKTRDLSESLQQQTATADVLKVISRSAFDLQTVLDTLVESATHLCEADYAWLFQRKGDLLHFSSSFGHGTAQHERIRDFFLARDVHIDRGSIVGRSATEGRVVHVADVLSDREYQWSAAQKIGGYRATLGAPLLRDGKVVGVIFVAKKKPEPYSAKQIELVTTFADQAVIAIENVRLFDEVQARTRELSESLEQQTATSEVLGVISRSAGDLEPVFQSMLENATRICGAQFGLMNLLEGDSVRTVGFHNVPPDFLSARKDSFRPRPDGILAQIIRTRQLAHTPDLSATALYAEGDPPTRHLVDLAGARTILVVPMLKDDELVGTIGIYRREVLPFNDKQIALLSSFANQAVIAIENARLLNELRQRTRELSQSLDDLRAAQDRLVQTEKLASLGQLTAGIAHEIKNPLNFVNNFSALSVELTDELNDILKQAELGETMRLEVGELTQILRSNLEKVVQHGKRADSIVKNMLLHSREGRGERRTVDINALVEESLNLAYHGARAEHSDFLIALERDLDPAAGQIELYPQEITRALLNMISNGFYAATSRANEAGNGYEPTLLATTRGLADRVEIRIRDNGTGIPPEVKDKMFNPFFTTKPAGEGTGLGLSMSHDIVVKQHGGTIDVETEPGAFTEIIVTLPRAAGAQTIQRGTT